MNEKDTLKTYVQAQLRGGIDAEVVKQQLTNGGWSEAIVGEAMREVAQQQQASLPQLSPAGQVAAASEEYGVMDAFKDAYRALQANLLGVISMMAIGFAISALAVVLGVLAGLGMIIMMAGSNNDISAQSFTVLVPLFVVYLAIFSLISAFTQALIGLAVNDGAEGRKSDIKNIVLVAAKRSPRVLVATILCALIATGPALLAIILVFVLAATVPSLAIVAYLLALVAIIIGPFIALRVLLMPVVALFETDVPLSGLFGRTRQLMQGSGAWFIIKFVLVVMAAAIVLSVVLPSERELESASALTSLVVGAVAAAFAAFYSAVLVVFYRNRRVVKARPLS